MSPENSSQIFNPLGPVSSGSGDQNIYMTAEFLRYAGLRPRVPGPWSEKHLSWLWERFVYPGRFQEAKDALERNSVVLLTAEAGSGRRTTALLLLDDAKHGRAYFHEIYPEPDSPSDNPWDASVLEAGDRVLLDLSAESERGHRLADRELKAYCAAVRDRGARLVVVAHHKHRLSDDHQWMATRIERPDTHMVLARYLRVEGFDFAGEPAEPARTDFLQDEPVRTTAALVNLMLIARSRNPHDGFAEWRRQAFVALADGAKVAARQIRRLDSGRQRALMLAAAMFSGLPADAAFGATADLLAAVRYPADRRHPFDRWDFAEELRRIGAEINPRRRIQFRRLAFDAAARAHYWDTVPDLRPKLAGWLNAAIRDPSLSAEDRDELVRRFAEQSLRIDRPTDVGELVSYWTKGAGSGRGGPLARQAVTALELWLRDERHGRGFRHLLYDWSRSANVTDGLAAAAIEVCAGELADSYPEQALVRLHYFSRRRGDTGELARRALVAVVAGDNRLLRRLLYRITRPDGKLFMLVADPYRLTNDTVRNRPLITDGSIRGCLVVGWRAEMTGESSGLLAERTRDWLQAAASDQGRSGRTSLLDVLAEAASGNFTAQSRLEAVAYSWALAPDGDRAVRAPVVRLLSRKIDTAPPPRPPRPDPDDATTEAAR